MLMNYYHNVVLRIFHITFHLADSSLSQKYQSNVVIFGAEII